MHKLLTVLNYEFNLKLKGLYKRGRLRKYFYFLTRLTRNNLIPSIIKLLATLFQPLHITLGTVVSKGSLADITRRLVWNLRRLCHSSHELVSCYDFVSGAAGYTRSLDV